MKTRLAVTCDKVYPGTSNEAILLRDDERVTPGEVAERVREILALLMENTYISGKIVIMIETGED